jgi:2-phospho-L-lactate guanylyltransferase
MILIPVKNLKTAKQRLAPVLDQAHRTALAEAMLHDVFETVSNWANRPPVAVVSSDPLAHDLAKHFDFETIPDDDNQSETAAVEMATQICESRSIGSTLVIPGDIPLVQSSELDTILKAAPPRGSVLVPISRQPARRKSPVSSSCCQESHWMWITLPTSATWLPHLAKPVPSAWHGSGTLKIIR